MLYSSFKMQQKRRKLLFVMFRIAKVAFSKERSCVSKKRVSPKDSRLLRFLDERVCGWSDEESVIFRRHLKAWITARRDA